MNTEQKYDLETRVCAGGCGKTFRCLPTSEARHARSNCVETCGKLGGIVGDKGTAQLFTGHTRPAFADSHLSKQIVLDAPPRSKGKQAPQFLHLAMPTDEFTRVVPAPTSSEIPQQVLVEEEPTPDDLPGDERMRLWLSAVEEAKKYVDDLHTARGQIVALARKVCDIHWGGGDHWTGHENVFTARRFAKEIGINYKTLMNWLRCWREIADALPKGEWKDEDYKFVHQTVKRCGANADRKTRVAEFRKLRDGAGDGKRSSLFRFAMIIQWARSHCNFLRAAKHGELPEKELLAMRALAEETLKAIDILLGPKPADAPVSRVCQICLKADPKPREERFLEEPSDENDQPLPAGRYRVHLGCYRGLKELESPEVK